MSLMSKALYFPLSTAASVVGGLIAGAIFTQLWKRLGDGDRPPPEPKDLDRSAKAMLAGAALQGLVFGLVRAAVARATAHGYKAVTHENPE
jgi:Protein of unknown function (DUF4235)